MKTIGLIVNPVAGIGGRVGLKGSDGADILARALELGAKPEAPGRAVAALKGLESVRDQIRLVTAPHEMGEDEAREAGFEPVVVGDIDSGHTKPADTQEIAKLMAAEGVDLIVFVGGDGTARDLYAALGEDVLALGIPAGCKIHSAVYAINPDNAAKAIAAYVRGESLTTKEAEVMDIDEDLFREGQVDARLYGYLKVPDDSKHLQCTKSGRCASAEDEMEGIGQYVADEMKPGVVYCVGTGSTTRYVMNELELPDTLLGVDIVIDEELVLADATEQQVYDYVKDREAYIIVTVIGGQGHIFGRGNQQFSPRVIHAVGKDHIIVIAAREKIEQLGNAPLRVDTGDEELDRELGGYIQVVVGYAETVMCTVE